MGLHEGWVAGAHHISFGCNLVFSDILDLFLFRRASLLRSLASFSCLLCQYLSILNDDTNPSLHAITGSGLGWLFLLIASFFRVPSHQRCGRIICFHFASATRMQDIFRIKRLEAV
jgi:hypothetical protein